QENYHFGNVRRMIAYALQVACHEHQSQRARDRGWVFEHIGQQLAKHLLADVVDVPIILDHTFRQIRIASNERVKALLENALCGRRSDRDIDDRFQFGSCMISSALRAMLTPLSPIRSISPTIFIAVVMKRRSEATGCSRARISKQMSSISSSSLSTSSSSLTTRWASDSRRSTRARVASAMDVSAL